nr:zinc finger bed domain-containing protein ricesleeper 2 [Quercus suber]
MSKTAIGKQKFEEAVKKLNLGGKDITSEGVRLRWDSTLFLLQIALEFYSSSKVDAQSSSYMDLSVEEWDMAEVMHKCLTVFYDAICSFLGSKCHCTNVYFSKIFDIYGSLLQRPDSDIAEKMRRTFDKYFGRSTFVSAIAAVFDPRTNLEFVHYSFRDLCGDDTKKCRVIDDAISHIFGLYAKDLCSQGLSSSFPKNDNISSSYGDYPRNILDKWKKSQREALFCGKDWLDNPIRITPNKDNDHSTVNPKPMLEISGSTSGIEPLPTGDTSHVWSGTLAPQEKHDPSNAGTELMLANGSATSCPKPLPLPIKEVNKMKRPEIAASYNFFGSKCLSTNVYFSKIVETCGSLLRLRESDIAKKMGMTFAPYFDFCTLVPAMAAVFDPRTNLKFVHYCFRYLYGDCTKLPTVIDGALSHMFGLYAKDLCSQGLSSSFPNNDNSSSSYGDNPCNILERWKKSQSSQMTQLDQYLREPPLHSDGELDILGWWHSKCQDSPALWAMARDILAIPMSTSTSNFAFCIETTTLDPIFNDLDPDIIEALFCGKDWLDNPIRITSNKDNDHSIANPEPMLENPGSTSGPEPLQTGDTLHVWSGTLEPQEKHDLSNADTELMLASRSATSCPEPLPLPTKNLDWSEIMNVFEPYTEIEKIICNYIFNEDLDGREVLVDMKYEFGDRAAFNALLPYQWITDEIINLVICKMTKEKRFSKIQAWYLPTRFSQRMMYEDGNPTLSWFKKSFRDNDKYMSKLVNCKQVTGLDKLLSYLENDNYTDSITKFALKSPPSNPRQNNGYDCGMYVIKHICTNIFNSYLPFLEGESERFRYKLAANLVLSKDNEQRSNIIERAKKFSLKDYFL